MQEEQGLASVECSVATQSITEKSNDTESRIEGESVSDKEKAGRKADSVQSIKIEIFMKRKKNSINLYVKVSS